MRGVIAARFGNMLGVPLHAEHFVVFVDVLRGSQDEQHVADEGVEESPTVALLQLPDDRVLVDDLQSGQVLDDHGADGVALVSLDAAVAHHDFVRSHVSARSLLVGFGDRAQAQLLQLNAQLTK